MEKGRKGSRYQDYFIKNGKLIGKFEEIYCDFDDPWEQSIEASTASDRLLGVSLLKKYGHRRVLEYGCGLGYFTEQLHRELGEAAGVDISNTAIKKAKSLFAGPEFYVGDILDVNLIKTFQPDGIILAHITWCILNKLASFKNLLLAECKDLGFLHLLTVYLDGQQEYGKDYFTNIDEIVSYWSDVIDIEEWGWQTSRRTSGTANTFVYGKVKCKSIR